MASVVTFDIKDLVNTREIYKILAYRQGITGEELIVVLIENQVAAQKKDRATVLSVFPDTKEIKVIK